jgi:hypothetical protein
MEAHVAIHSRQPSRRQGHLITALLVLALVTVGASAPLVTGTESAPAKQTLAVLAVNLNLARANAVVPGDTEMGTIATTRLRAALASQGAYDLIAPARVDSAMTARGMPCTADLCAIEVAHALGADVVLAVSLAKIATPVWYADTRLLDAKSGRLLRADEFELKGIPQQMIPMGMESIARRVSQVGRGQGTAQETGSDTTGA